MKHAIRTEVVINAPPEAVWASLTDLERHGEWNPFVVEAHGAPALGARLKIRLQPPGGRGMTFKPRVTALEPHKTFEWLGRLGLPGIFDGRHRFELEPVPGGTRLVQSEEFSGVLVRWMRGSLDGGTRQGFEAMNAALKARCEAATGLPAAS